jgi:hypothetical protein
VARIILLLTIAIVLPCPASAQERPLWGSLIPGSYGVGFKSLWQLDYSRRYNMTFDDKSSYASTKAPRPILINIWYPAKTSGSAKPMPHSDYLRIQSTDPKLKAFANKLTEYDHGAIAKELFQKPFKELNDQQKKVLQLFLDTPPLASGTPSPLRASSRL